MKYIKLFESHNYYFELSEDECGDHSRDINFSKNIIIKILNLIKDKEYFNKSKIYIRIPRAIDDTRPPLDNWRWQNWNDNISNFDIKGFMLSDVSETSKLVNISQLPDDWYSVRLIVSHFHNLECKYYKCDQWDGLVKCLKDLEII